VGNIAAAKVTEAMRNVQARFAEIENLTGISFSAQLRRAELHRDSEGTFNDLVERPRTDSVAYAEHLANELAGQAGRPDLFVPPGTASTPAGSAPPTAVSGFARLAPSDFDDLFLEIAEIYDLNPALLKAVAFVESTFRPDVTSGSGAMGMMQLMPATAEALGVTDPFDPRQSVDGGARYIAQNLNRFNGNTLLALAAYHAGWPRISESGADDLRDPAQRGLIPNATSGYLARIEEYLAASQASYVLDDQTVLG
jgi:soluble lytic murein transglycosylase-like protein